MKETNIKCYIKNIAFSINNVYNLIGKINKEDCHIKYNENDIEVDLYFNEEIKIKREHQDYVIEITFIPDDDIEGRYILKETNTYIYLKIKTTKIEKRENSIKINYDLTMANEEMKNFEYYIEWS